MEKKKAIEFCLECTIPGVLTSLEEADSRERKKLLVTAVVSQAFKDANKGARNNKNGCFGNRKSREDAYSYLVNQLSDYCGNDLSSQYLIEMVKKAEPKASHAFIQKMVNMTLKYILVLQELKEGIPGITVMESECDCPIDSIALRNLLSEAKEKGCSLEEGCYKCWTQQDEDDYKSVQNGIDSLGYSTRIKFDFYNWKH